jgi:hypothetical protein
MCAKIFQILTAVLCLILFGTAGSFAQAVFTVSSTQPTAADIGHAELAGSIGLTVVTGTSVAAPLNITYSAPITNNNSSEITITGTGALALSTVSLDRATNSLLVGVAAGGQVGDSIEISGVRVAIAGLNLSQVSASIYSPSPSANSVTSGETNPVVIASVMQPFSIDQSSQPPLSYAHGTVTQWSTSFTIAEIYPNAFAASAAGVGRIRIVPFPAIPEGLQIHFPTSVFSGDAIFRTVSGSTETVPRTDGSTDVVYQFIEGANSIGTREAFVFSATMSGSAAGSGTIQFQAALIPIGLAVPSPEFPSTDMPRYAERLLPDEIELVSGTTELFFPFRSKSEDAYTGVALTNPLNYRVRATLTAYDAAGRQITGENITNPVQVDLARKGQYARLASEIFGSDFNASSNGMIRVVGRSPNLRGFYLTGDNSGPKLDGSVGIVPSAFSWQLPVVSHQGIAPFNLLEIYNPGTADAPLNLRLMDGNGNQVATQSTTIVPGGTLLGDFGQIFNIYLHSFSGGYIRGDSELPLIVRENFGNALEANVLDVKAAISQTSYSIPHFASGAQYSTELTLVNADSSFPADITLTPFNDAGVAIADPANVIIMPGAQVIRTVASLFPGLGSGLVTGSIKVAVKTTNRGPILYAPPLLGCVRFANIDGSASASLPLLITPSNDFVYSHLAQNSDWFTGVAVLNPNAEPASVTVAVYTSEGLQTGTYATTLQPGERFSKLVYELVPASRGQLGGYVRVSSNAYVTSFALFGTNDLQSLSAIPPQDAK